MLKAAKAGMKFTVLGSLFFKQLFPEFHLNSLKFVVVFFVVSFKA